jgi:hypothetical protein
VGNAATAIAGVHYVCAELSQAGYSVAPTSRNTEAIDILASTPEGTKTVAIQVKTRAPAKKVTRWPLHPEDVKRASDSLFYVFVELKGKESERPDFYVASSKFVSKKLAQGISEYNERRSKRGKPPTSSRIQAFWKSYLDEGHRIVDYKDWEKLFAKPD